MILYNVTVSIDENVAEEWLKWMREVHIPDVMKTGLFLEGRICRILAFEEGGLSYSVQYLSPSEEAYNIYQQDHAPTLQQEHTERYAGKFAAFRTILKVEETFKLDS